MPVLDTTFLIDAERGSERIRDLMSLLAKSGESLCVPGQAFIEYAAGLADPAIGLRRLGVSFEFIVFDETIALEAARLAHHAFTKGLIPGWADIQVAATAKHLGMAIVTRNPRQFEPLGVRVEPYSL